MERICPVVIEKALRENNFSITDTSKKLAISGSELWDYIGEYGILMRKSKELPTFDQNPLGDICSLISLLEDFMKYCDYNVDFRNGNTDTLGLIDEGQVNASNFFYKIESKIKEIRDRNNL